MNRRRGMTRIELLIGIAAGVLGGLFLLILSYTCFESRGMRRAREGARRAICRSCLKAIGSSLAIYANSYSDRFPILPDINPEEPTDYRGDLRLSDECTAQALGTGAQQNLSLLVKEGSIGWKVFLCPSTGTQVADRDAPGRKYGLGEVERGKHVTHVDYALQIPYPKTPEGTNSCPWKGLEGLSSRGSAQTRAGHLREEKPAFLAIMADRGPRGEYRTRWSPNHGNDGESVLFLDGHVDWSQDQRGKDDLNAAGFGGNNIYTADQWDGTPDAPVLKANGTENRTPTDPNGTRDSVLYHWW